MFGVVIRLIKLFTLRKLCFRSKIISGAVPNTNAAIETNIPTIYFLAFFLEFKILAIKRIPDGGIKIKAR